MQGPSHFSPRSSLCLYNFFIKVCLFFSDSYLNRQRIANCVLYSLIFPFISLKSWSIPDAMQKAFITSSILIFKSSHSYIKIIFLQTISLPCTYNFLFWLVFSRSCFAPFSQKNHTHTFSHLSDFLCQFYNALCRNLPRRYVLPLTVDEQTPLDRNLVNLGNYKATAKKTKPGEVGLNMVIYVHCLCKVICLTVRYPQFNFTGTN